MADHVIRRKHTANAKRDLPGLIAEVVEPLADARDRQQRVFNVYRGTQLTTELADHAIMEMYRSGVINLQRIAEVDTGVAGAVVRGTPRGRPDGLAALQRGDLCPQWTDPGRAQEYPGAPPHHRRRLRPRALGRQSGPPCGRPARSLPLGGEHPARAHIPGTSSTLALMMPRPVMTPEARMQPGVPCKRRPPVTWSQNEEVVPSISG